MFLHRSFCCPRFQFIWGPGKISWRQADVRAMAISIKQNLPLSVSQLLSGNGWNGGDLIQMEDTVTSAKAEDLIINYCWAKPVTSQFRDRIPSGFYLTDVFLYLDRIWFGKLLVPREVDGVMMDKTDLAAYEAKKMKSLLSGLRSLWRSSTLASYDSLSEFSKLMPSHHKTYI